VKRPLILVLKLAVVAALIVYLGRSLWEGRAGLAKLTEVGSGLGWLALAQLCIALVLFLQFHRWQILLSAQGIDYSFREACALGFIGFFFNQFVPGSTGGDLVKAYYVAVDHPERRAAGVTTVFLDRVVGLLMLVVLAGGAVAANWSRIAADPVFRSLAAVVAVALGLSAAGSALFFSERFRASPTVRAALGRLPFRDLLGKIQAAIYVYKFHPRLVLLVIALSLVVQVALVVAAICYALALGGGVDLAVFFFIVPLANLALSIPIGSPGGLGQSEFAFQELFARAGYPHGLLIALLQRLNWYLWGLWGGVLYLKRRERVQRARALAHAAESAGAPELAAELEGGGGAAGAPSR